MRNRRLERRIRNTRRIATNLSIIIAAIIIVSISYSWLFVIKNITCILDANPCPEPVTQTLSFIRGDNLLRLKQDQIKSTITEKLPQINVVELEPHIPGSVTINLFTVEPLANLRTSTQSAVFLVGTNHQIISQIDEPTANPTIIYAQATGLQAGQTIQSSTLNQTLDAVSLLKDYFLPVSTVTAYDSHLILDLPKNKQAYFGLDEDHLRQVKALDLIYNSSNLAKEVTIIDLRPERPVLTTPLDPTPAPNSSPSATPTPSP